MLFVLPNQIHCNDLFLKVYRGTWRGTDVAIKKLLNKNITKAAIEEFEAEVSVMV